MHEGMEGIDSCSYLDRLGFIDLLVLDQLKVKIKINPLKENEDEDDEESEDLYATALATKDAPETLKTFHLRVKVNRISLHATSDSL
mmetsp:Transcript_30236/g.46230  ORF Transcript_30236/g.46230 Transcript_30236/m.46230 type:complete len:87 (+) Transcript_30236:112-372(+)